MSVLSTAGAELEASASVRLLEERIAYHQAKLEEERPAGKRS
jgi:hypothetical protein